MDLELLEYLEGFLTERRRERFQEILATRTRYLTVALEDVYQLHNASAVIRSCDAFGIQDAHLVVARYGSRLDKNIAKGAQQWVDIHKHRSGAACVRQLRKLGYRIVATSPHGDAVRPEALELSSPIALFFGTEKDGLSEDLLEEADATVRIPMVGFSESLNISVAAAILLHVLSDRLRASGMPWQMTESEILEKRMDWARKTVKSSKEILARYPGRT